MFADPIGQWRRTQPEKVAVIDHSSGERVSYAELDARIDRMAARLRTLGVQRGDRVGVLATNRIEQIELFYGCHRVGAALVPFNWRLAATELHGIIEDARIAICFGEEKFRSLARAALLEARFVGKARLPSTVLGLLFHAAEHASRHTGQVVTTAKVVAAENGLA